MIRLTWLDFYVVVLDDSIIYLVGYHLVSNTFFDIPKFMSTSKRSLFSRMENLDKFVLTFFLYCTPAELSRTWEFKYNPDGALISSNQKNSLI